MFAVSIWRCSRVGSSRLQLTSILPHRLTVFVKGDEPSLVQRRADIEPRLQIERDVRVDSVFGDERIRQRRIEHEISRQASDGEALCRRRMNQLSLSTEAIAKKDPHLSSLHGDFVSLDRTSSLIVVLQPSRELTESIHAPIGILKAAHRTMLALEDPQRFLAPEQTRLRALPRSGTRPSLVVEVVVTVRRRLFGEEAGRRRAGHRF